MSDTEATERYIDCSDIQVNNSILGVAARIIKPPFMLWHKPSALIISAIILDIAYKYNLFTT